MVLPDLYVGPLILETIESQLLVVSRLGEILSLIGDENGRPDPSDVFV